ncbi:transcription elongation factor Spt5 [Cylindrobasidium torrendii FP15055 ss-10]|uniref:Transcription elongation factor SPT5 n=1 Tax=Cylindrobasidium torrendii FP15055 ss-10 TaxID=1314674 RepID=A0A0D7B115_9AGAR|nr:transcription elongation factor Spt5 [Cylindrobasidium torrendii FP15055 ss-10]
MSDVEDFDNNPNKDSEADIFDDDDEDLPDPPQRSKYQSDEDEEDEDEEEEEAQSGRKPKKRKRRTGASRFLDVEAEVSDDEDEEMEDEEFGHSGFIEEDHEIGDDAPRNSGVHHRRLDRQYEEEDAEQIVQNIRQRHGGRSSARYTGDMNDIPQRLLMPSVQDANLWQVRVKPGREKDIVMSIIRRAIDQQYSGNPLHVLSAFQRDTLSGMIYVEARSAKHVTDACRGLVGVFATRPPVLVPIDEMAPLLTIKKQETKITPGTWVRIKRGKYAGDLAQVIDLTDNGEEVGLKYVPRIDMTPVDDNNLDTFSKKRKKITGNNGLRPPQRLFNYEEVLKVHGRTKVHNRGPTYFFEGDTYKNGFLEKDYKLSQLSLDDVNPTLEEITMFTQSQGADGVRGVDLSAIAEASKKAAIAVLQPGDQVEVFEGEQAGVYGAVEAIAGNVVTITARSLEMEGQKIDVPARSVRKKFKAGDHVKVMSGRDADETGLVVSVSGDVVTFLSDMSMQEVSVFSKDLREAAEVGSGTNIIGNYELHDLVQLDLQTVGVIFKTERDSFRVIDQNGSTRIVKPHQITMRKDSRHAIATDHDGHELRIGDNVKEVDGEGRKGQVLHVHQAFHAFLHNREIAENGGVFVTRTRSLASLAPKANVAAKAAASDLSKMNPAMVQPQSSGVLNSRGPRDRSIGTFVQVTRGPHKGYVGRIVDTNGNLARVELTTRNKVIAIEKEKLMQKMPDGSVQALGSRGGGGGGRGGYGGGGGGRGGYGGGGRGGYGGNMGPPPQRTANPYASGGQGGATPGWGAQGGMTPWGGQGGRTPGWGAGGRTPAPNMDSRTPAWNASSRTPNPYATDGGGKTPGWNATGRTPNPYAGNNGQTPAWNPSSTTPNPYANNSSGNAWGATSSSSWGGATPGRPTATSAWDNEDNWNAPTPAAATSPEFLAPTPYSAETPGGWGEGTASTPAPAAWDAPTPISAPTPGFFDDSLEDVKFPDDWITFPKFMHVQKRMCVFINGTREGEYLNGDYEGQRGRIDAGMVTGATPTAYIEWDDPGLEARSMKADYIFPVQDGLKEDDVVLIGAGKHQGATGTIQRVEENGDYAVDIDDSDEQFVYCDPSTVVLLTKEE